ncbi:polymerase [Pantoea sp. 1.19]|uniref:polymerase n=1 Tax=Pantoea sp. 1.19 TaxID=1925589 RepID=UPI000948E5BB|nr:polymerase [Pantoea sp. 1.19]
MENANKLFIFLITTEIIIGGGGRLLDPLGLFPLRYLFFAISFVFLILNFITGYNTISKKMFLFFLLIMTFPFYGALLGAIYGRDVNDIAFDLQPYAYSFFLLYIFSLKPSLKEYLFNYFIKCIKYFSIITSCFYIFYVILLHAGFIDFIRFYNVLSLTDEFFFRPSGAFFSKSFFFFGIASVIFFIERKYFFTLLLLLAILLTETRGVFLFACLAILATSFRLNKMYINLLVVMVGLLSFLALMVLVGDRGGDSDSVRINDWNYFIANSNLTSLIFGTGFGTHFFERLRIEVVPLEILQKTGLIGVVVSILPVLLLIRKGFNKLARNTDLVMSGILIFSLGVSITNPFLYTPMGIFVLGVSAIAILSEKSAKDELSKGSLKRGRNIKTGYIG